MLNAKEFLQKSFEIAREIKTIQIEVSNLRDFVEQATSPIISDMPKNKSLAKDKMADSIAKIVDLESKWKERMAVLVDHKRAIAELISKMQNSRHRELLSYRYVKGLEWNDIEREMHFTRNYLYKLHGSALNEFREIYKTFHTFSIPSTV